MKVIANNTILTAAIAVACALGMTMVRADESKTLTAVKTGAAITIGVAYLCMAAYAIVSGD